MAAFCFDVVVLENDTYNFWATENGAFEGPGASVLKLEDRRLIFNEGGQVSLFVGPVDDGETRRTSGPPILTNEHKPLLSGEALVAYCADFYPVLKSAGVLDEPCFKWINDPLPQPQAQLAAEAAEADKEDQEFWGTLPFHRFERDYVIKSFYHDTARNESLRLPTLFDDRVSEYTRLKGLQLAKRAPDVAPHIYQVALVNRMADITAYSWEKVLDLRNKPAAQEFRDMLARVRGGVLAELPNLRSEADVRALTTELFFQELADEVAQQSSKTLGGVAFNLLLNLVPIFGPFIGATNEAARYIESRQSWTALFKPRRH